MPLVDAVQSVAHQFRRDGFDLANVIVYANETIVQSDPDLQYPEEPSMSAQISGVRLFATEDVPPNVVVGVHKNPAFHGENSVRVEVMNNGGR